MERTKHLADFYAALGKPMPEYKSHLDTVFLPNLAKWKIFGGASSDQAAAAIQEAVNALEVYSQLGHLSAFHKRNIFASLLKKHGRTVPTPSADVTKRAADMKLISAQFNVLTRKFMLLDYWQAVATGDAEPDMPDDGEHWALHYFLNFDPLKVRPILELMLDDAADIVKRRHWDATLERWAGADATKQVKYDKTAMSTTIKANALARVGCQINGEFAVEYKGFKLKAEAEAFAGARARAEGSASFGKSPFDGLSVKGEIEVEVGIRIKAGVKIDVLDILELEAGLDALAGAMAKAEAELTVNYQGIKIKVGAEFFAGAKITGTAKGTLKLGGRPILGAAVEASACAGIGASASAEFECSLFGKVGFGAKAGLTVGVGAELGTKFMVDFHNIAWGAANAFWILVNEAGFKNKGKVWFLPIEENVKMCNLLRDRIFQMMSDLYRNNEESADALEEWALIKRRILSVPQTPLTHRYG